MAEITLLDDDMLLHLGRGDYISAKRHWLENLNGQPVEEHGIRLTASGTVSPADVEWRIGPLVPAVIHGPKDDKKKRLPEEMNKAFVAGFDLARQSLFKMLLDGPPRQ